jgi:hypothetical protein
VKNNPQRNRERSAEWRQKNPGESRRQQLWHKFRITPEEYDKLLMLQNGVCAICKKSCPTGRQLAVDHCHVTKQIRGLLCVLCNNSLGGFKDDTTILQQAIEYLRKYGNQQSTSV